MSSRGIITREGQLNPPRFLLYTTSTHFGSPIQPTQISLPSDCEYARRNRPHLSLDEGEIEELEPRPDKQRIEHTSRYRILNPLHTLTGTSAGEQAGHPKIEGVENRCEDDLIDGNLGQDTQQRRCIVEIARKKHEPTSLVIDCSLLCVLVELTICSLGCLPCRLSLDSALFDERPIHPSLRLLIEFVH